jgi:hypothetical protein
MTTWMFQNNPTRYDLLARARDGFSDQWSMNQHRDKVAVGDRVYFFVSGPAAGIYVVATIVSPTYDIEMADEFGRHKVDVEYEAFVDPYISRSVLTDRVKEPLLASYAPFRGMQQTNFILPPGVAARLDVLSAPRLRPIPKKPWQGFDVSLHAVDTAIKEHATRVRAQLLAALKELDPYVFEAVIGRLLARLGYEDAVVTSKSNDKGVDVTATLRLEGVTEVPTELRGALTPGQHGVIITTSGFTRDAATEATATGKAPIALVDGHGLVDLLMKKRLGVQTRLVPLFTLALDDLLAESAKDQ